MTGELVKRNTGGVARQRKLGTITIENAEIIFPNFAGMETQYNREGDRNFNIVLPDDVAERMIDEGWNVKTLKVREEGDEPRKIVQVSINYKNRPPRINLITSRGRNPLPEDLVDTLQYSDVLEVDVTIRPYEWGPINGNSGVKAYLQTMFVVIDEDPLDLKWNAIEDHERHTLEGSDDIIDAEVVEEHYPRAIGG